MLSLVNVAKSFGGQKLFEDVNLSVHAGEKAGVVGPNGSGKTTLLRLIEGVEEPDSGSARLLSGMKIGVLRQEIASSRATVLEEVLAGDAELSALRVEQEELHQRLSDFAHGPEREALHRRWGEVEHRLQDLGSYAAESRAGAILLGLGFTMAETARPLESFSGGWRLRVALARLLFSRPDVMLLDEPTNHLDLESVAWLEGYLARLPATVLVVSHSRGFLNRVTGVTLAFEEGTIHRYVGNFDRYLEQREAALLLREKTAVQQEKRIEELERFIRRFRAKATKAKQAQSRVKMLEKMDKVERVESARAAPRLRLPEPPGCAREMLKARGLAKSYDGKPLFSGVNLLLERGRRIGLLGPNGSGKSSFLKIAAGRLAFEGGQLELGERVVPAYYAQHALENLDAAHSVLESAAQGAPLGMGETALRTLLGGFLFSGDAAFKRVGVLSGGEKARLALARLFLSGANLLLLDEPTNHLDMNARAALEEALESYPGAFLLVSHDRELLEAVCDGYWVVEGGVIQPLEGALEEYLQRVSARRSAAPVEKAATVRKEASRRDHEERRQRERTLRQWSRKVEEAESRVARLESAREEVERVLGDGTLYEAGAEARLNPWLARHREVEAELAAAYAEWERLTLAAEEVAAVE
ncbi:MAG: ATP-binding cassette domain-containing protein [Magnetococcales bacterium]|nr:ATP-binding cassette domain-containing protein [Magnetococcales bacterium]